MRRADRLFQIVQQLRGGRLVTAAMLAERLGVSDRTIYRDIADLTSSGVPIEGAAGVGYVLRHGFNLPPLMFTTDEVVALVVGARLVQAYGGREMAAASEEALVKIAAVLPPTAARRADSVPMGAFTPPPTAAARDHLDELGAAIDDERRVILDYRDESGQGSHRTVRPLGLYFWGRVWTLVAWCELREGFRMFRVDRIERLARGLRFQPDPKRGLQEALTELRRCAPDDPRVRSEFTPRPLARTPEGLPSGNATAP